MTQATLRCVQASLYPTGLPLKQSRNSSLFEPRLVTSSTAIGKMFSCEAPNTANARDGSLESRNSAKEKRSYTIYWLISFCSAGESMRVIHQRTKNRPTSTPKLRLKKLSKQTDIKPTFYSVLLDVKGVELASTVDHVTVIEMNAIARLAGLNLLRKNRRISADVIV